MNKKTRLAILLAVPVTLGLTAAVLAAFGVIGTRGPTAGGVLISHGDDHLPNRTAVDWVTYADYVVVVTPTKEAEISPAPEEVAIGEGLILRKVTLRVDEVLWARPRASVAAPQSFDWTAWGWQFKGKDLNNRVRMAGEDEPRIELGHRYIMAVVWEPASCPPGNDDVPAQWRGLGARSTVPYDGDAIGQGELEGRIQSISQARERAQSHPDVSLADQLVGERADVLRDTLSRTTPDQPKQYGPSPVPCG